MNLPAEPVRRRRIVPPAHLSIVPSTPAPAAPVQSEPVATVAAPPAQRLVRYVPKRAEAIVVAQPVVVAEPVIDAAPAPVVAAPKTRAPRARREASIASKAVVTRREPTPAAPSAADLRTMLVRHVVEQGSIETHALVEAVVEQLRRAASK
jgi:hypothetical protein